MSHIYYVSNIRSDIKHFLSNNMIYKSAVENNNETDDKCLETLRNILLHIKFNSITQQTLSNAWHKSFGIGAAKVVVIGKVKYCSLHTQRNLIKSTRNQIVFTTFRFIWN